MRLFAAVFCVFMAAWFCAPAHAELPPSGMKGCKKESTDKNPTIPGSPVTLQGPDGAMRVQPAYSYILCSVKSTGRTFSYTRDGLLDANGKTLVPFRYDEVLLYTTDRAFVKREDGHWATYIFSKGETKDVPAFSDVKQVHGGGACARFTTDVNKLGPASVLALGPASSDGKRDGAIYFASDAPVILRSLGGEGITEPLRREGDIVVAQWIDAGGVKRSRIHDLAGQAISPILGEVAYWITKPVNWTGDESPQCADVLSRDIFVVGPVLDRDVNSQILGSLLTPLDSKGEPVQLPPGAIGMMAVTLNHPFLYTALETKMWAVVFDTPRGTEFTVSAGSPANAIERSAVSRRFTDMARFNENSVMNWLFVRRASDQLWEGHTYGVDQVRGEPQADVSMASHVARTTYYDEAAAWNRAQDQLRAEKKAKDDAAYEALWVEAWANGNVCNRFAVPWDRGTSELTRYVRECPSYFNYADIERARTLGVPEDAVAGSIAWLEESSRARAEQARLAMEYVPPVSWERVMRNWVDGAIAQSNADQADWMADRQRKYYEELERANRR